MNVHLGIGKKVFENVPKEKAPLWGSLLLNEFRNSPFEESKEIKELRELIKSNEWDKCHRQFSKIRNLTLNNEDKQKEIYFKLAENISKITYNQTETNTPFDSDAGFWIYDLAIRYANSADSKNKIKRIEGILNLFQTEKNNDNFFALEAKSSGNELLKNIFTSNEPDMQELRTELPKECQLDEISLSNPISRLYNDKKNIPNGSFEFQFDLMFYETKIGYYSLIWDNEIVLLDEYFVINKST